MTSQHGFDTFAIHAGQEPDPLTGAVVPPIYQVSTYAQDGVGAELTARCHFKNVHVPGFATEPR